ncbi:MAG: bifunctional folylpolyglutamate synthase/dihydrofolate synthase [Bacteroidales bacterium]|jgi:dihydrofolate synthase/folylpolyglutamate synthase|nr:bifunctional folylpolyglutamate synthase/dihydrofolate synthase [Bacteroidales bacterium]
MDYSQTVQYLFGALPAFRHIGGVAYKPGLQTIRELCTFYGYPHRNYLTVHIAGTNGKGSVSHMLAAVLQGCGYTTGLFTSPHLTDFRERIRVNGVMIPEQDVIEFTERSREMFDKVQPSFFEATVAMAFDYFNRRKVDVAVIETGMGGRLDATNIITPVLSVITNISMDHTQFLGNNPIAIASEKAGIIKRKVPVVIGETQSGTSQVFEYKAQELDCPIVFADRIASVSRAIPAAGGQTFYISRGGNELPLPIHIDLNGDYQRKNIITALVAIQDLRLYTSLSIPAERICPSLEHAAQTTGLRGRWQTLCRKPLTICDAGHNIAGLSWAVRQMDNYDYRRLRIIIGFVSDKDVAGMLQLLPAHADYYFTRANIPRALDERILRQKAQEAGLQGNCYSSVATAIDAAFRAASPDDFIFIGGSMFVTAEAITAVETRGE